MSRSSSARFSSSSSSASSSSLTSKAALGVTDWAVIGLVHFLVLALLVASFAGASGSHFNPAVTITLAALQEDPGRRCGVYILMQFAGAILAALVVKAPASSTRASSVNYGATLVSKQFFQSDFPGFVGRGHRHVHADARRSTAPPSWCATAASLAPIIIGGALGGAVMCIGPLTGAGLNPARAFGPALVANAFAGGGTFLFVYILGPIVGALLAGITMHAIYGGEEEMPEAIEPPGDDPSGAFVEETVIVEGPAAT